MLNNITVSEIAKFLGKEYSGNNFCLNSACSISKLKDNAISFVNNKNHHFDFSKKALIISLNNTNSINKSNCSFIYSLNPRLDFIKVVNEFFVSKDSVNISETARIGENCKIGKNVTIGEYSVIKDNVTIGAGTVINNHVVIESNTIIGIDCYIKSGAIIGEDGFGFERDENGIPLRFPHIGNVIIGNDVEIGANSTISRGTLESTIIKDNTKIDDQVFIAHNVEIGESAMIVSCSEISGSTKIGKNCWIGPNSTIKDGLTIGDNVFLGIACSVSKNIDSNTKLGTITDLKLRDIVKINKLLKAK
jgi:UDP-3-O-[3-hydroxymyristoyl] glucosamine N-acyltransferase LpxD